MSRLDQHVLAVRNRLALARFFYALAWTTLILAALVFLAVLLDKIFQVRLPWPHVFLITGIGLSIVFALAYAIFARLDAFSAAVAIDDKLSLKEKYSTALHLRTSRDPFAQAAVRDAEVTAGNTLVQTARYFPIQFPRPAYGTLLVSILAFSAWYFISPLNLFGRETPEQHQLSETQKTEEAKKTLAAAYMQVDTAARSAPDNMAIQTAKKELEAMMQNPPKDPQSAQRSALKALQDTRDAVNQKMQDSQSFADAKNQERLFRSMTPPTNDTGPVAEAHKAIAEGKFDTAMQELQKAVDNFDKMDKKDQAKAAQQMQQMAQQLKNMANNPQMAQAMQQQFQRMGATPQQAKQMQQLAQQAAQGNQQAQKQLQQMAQQQMQQMNNGQGPTPQQQQQIQQIMKQMQAQSAAQAQAQQMSQSAQAMAQAMQQQSQSAQQSSQQQQAGQQQMSSAQQQMQQQMAAMDAIQKDAAAQAAQQQALDQAAQAAAGQCNGGQQSDQGAGNKPGGQKGGSNPWRPGQPKGNGAGMGGPGNGNGGQGEKEFAPYTVKAEKAPVQDIKNGRILAVSLVNAGTVKGESKEQLKDVARAARQDETDEVDQELIGRSSQQAVKSYFNSIEQDATK